MIATTARHLLRARPGIPSLAIRAPLDGGVARWSTSATGEGAPSSREAGREAAVRAPFEAHRSSATVRLQRTPPSGSTSGARAPIPGRLVREPRRADANIDAVKKGSGAPTAVGAGGGPYAPLPREPSARAERRKAAVERRRMLLEQGVAVTKPNPAGENKNAVSAQTDTSHAHNEGGSSARGPRKITIIKEIVRPPPTMPMEGDGNARQTIVPRRGNIPLHSLGDGQLSAADVHRRRLREMREQRRQEEQAGPVQDVQTQEPQGINQTQSQDRNVPNQATARRSGGGGSMVFARSATAKYREERHKHSKGEGALKANPSSVAIPLSDDSALGSDVKGASTGGASSGPDFEERYQKLRRRQGGKEEDEKEDGGWSLFGWLRGGK